jgi:hypothetical protein
VDTLAALALYGSEYRRDALVDRARCGAADDGDQGTPLGHAMLQIDVVREMEGAD